MFTRTMALGTDEITAPHDFGFQLRHYVVAPEVREGQKLIDILRLSAETLVKVDVISHGTVTAPELELNISSPEPLALDQVGEIRERVAWHLSLDDDLGPFYRLVESDPILSASVEYNFGAKGKRAHSMFDAVVDVILAQNTAFRRLYSMRANLGAAFGDRFVADGRVYHAPPTPQQLAAAPIEAIRATRVGYRDKYIKGVAEAVARGVDLEAIKDLPREEARRELMKLPGVGPYTADLAFILGARQPHVLFLDLFIREVLRQFYFGGASVPDRQFLEFADARWGPYQGHAGLYLTTNTDAWAKKLGIAFRLRSGALSDPDTP